MANEVDKYISEFSEEKQKLLEQIRACIKKAAPQATETINYGIPTFVLNGNLVHFGAGKNHIGFYPTPPAIEKFKDQLSGYKGAKGSIQFPLDKPMPLELITEMVKYRVTVNMDKVRTKNLSPHTTKNSTTQV